MNKAEQLAHNLAHAVKMARTHGTFHHLGNWAKMEHTRVGFRINIFDTGHECDVNATRLEHGGIGLGIARIGAQVFLVVELSGVQKHTHHNNVVFAASSFHKRLVTLMQSTHRGH